MCKNTEVVPECKVHTKLKRGQSPYHGILQVNKSSFLGMVCWFFVRIYGVEKLLAKNQPVVILAPFILDLQGDVADAECISQHGLHVMAHGLGLAERHIPGDVEVGLQVNLFVIHLPHVQVVEVVHLRQRLHCLFDFLNIDMAWRSLHQDIDRLAYHAPGVVRDVTPTATVTSGSIQ